MVRYSARQLPALHGSPTRTRCDCVSNPCVCTVSFDWLLAASCSSSSEACEARAPSVLVPSQSLVALRGAPMAGVLVGRTLVGPAVKRAKGN